MDGILIIDKESGMTSRDVVNMVGKNYKTKKIGHTGTLDPLATGVLVVCVNRATKIAELLTSLDKEYVAEFILGRLTDTLDIEGNLLKSEETNFTKDEVLHACKKLIGSYIQTVPIYSAVKVNGKKLYEYARKNKKVELPKRKVAIKSIKLLESNDDSYKFKVVVSKGTYIRSLIKDINDRLNIIGVMSDLRRTRQGKFCLGESYTLNDIDNNKYKILSINDVLKNEKCVIIDDTLYKLIKNGGIIDNKYDDECVTFVYNYNVVAIYKVYSKDNTKMKPYKMFV